MNSLLHHNELVKLVKEMRSTNNSNFYNDITNTLELCIILKSNKTTKSQEWSMVLEQHIRTKFKIRTKNDNTSGDGCSLNNKNIEIKVSLGGKNKGFNFVQIRPDHNIDYYIILCYDLYDQCDLGKIYWMLCPSKDLYELIPRYGSYAHGNICNNGVITSDNIYGRNLEYALRPNPYSGKNTKGFMLWNILIQKFQKEEQDIINHI